MKKWGVVFPIAVLCWFIGFAPDDSADPNERASGPSTYYQPSQAYRVTIRSDKGIVTRLEVLKGVYLSLHGAKDQDSFHDGSREDFPHTFLGPLAIRMRRTDEIEANESLISRQVMAKAPLEISLGASVVVIDTFVVEGLW